MHISLDGFAAGPNGEMDWITVNDEVFDFVEKRIGPSDAAMYGRVTFEMMESYWPTAADEPDASRHDKVHSKWYSKAHKIVMSKTMKDSALTNTTIISDNLSDRINEIKKEEGTDILLFGSPSATHALIDLDLIDGYWLFVNPIILGRGIPLFTGNEHKTKLQLVSTHQFRCGVTELNYLVEK